MPPSPDALRSRIQGILPAGYEAKTGAVRELSARGFMLGVMPDEVYAEQEVRSTARYQDALVRAQASQTTSPPPPPPSY